MAQISVVTKVNRASVIEVNSLTESTYLLRFERNNFNFKPGQYIVIGLPGRLEKREYSIYSSVNSPYLEVLIKEVENGIISKKLKRLKPNDTIEIGGPFGFFGIDEKKQNEKYMFIASGTGISPFHSIITSYPEINYTLLHGVRHLKEAYDKHLYNKNKYIQCTSRDINGDFDGRVTDYLRKHPVDVQMYFYLCGNSEMIDDAYRILESQGVPPAHLFAEVYF